MKEAENDSKQRQLAIMRADRIIIAGGGTGGHIFPAIAIANAILKLKPTTEILFVGAKGKMEMEKVPLAGFRIEGLTSAGFNRSSLIKNIGLPYKIAKSFFQVADITAKYKPDAVIYFAHSDERNKMIKDISNIIKRNIPIKYPFLQKVINLCGVNSEMSEKQIKQLLTPYIDCILQWSYAEMASICKKNNAKIIWIYLLTTEDTVNENEYNTIYKFAKQAGAITLNIKNPYKNIPRSQIQISETNTHPNILGHQLIANDFYKEIIKHKHDIFNKKQ